MSKSLPCGRKLRALNFALLFVVLGWFCTIAPAHAKNYNVANYGVLPDGNDYTSKIQDLLYNIPPGSTVTFPAGTYIVSDSLLVVVPVKLVGQNATLNMVPGPYGGGAILLPGGNSSIQNLTVNWAGSEFSIPLLGPNTTVSAGVYLGGESVSVTGCTFNCWPSFAVVLYECTGNSTASGNTFNVVPNSVGLGLLNLQTNIQKVTVTGSTFSSPQWSGGNTGIYAYGANDLIATQNTFTNFDCAINADDGSYSGTTSATYNIFTNGSTGVSATEEDSLIVTNNTFQGAWTAVSDNSNGGAVINDNSMNSLVAVISSSGNLGTLTAKGNTIVSGAIGISVTDAYSFVGSMNNFNALQLYAIQMEANTVKLTNNFINSCATGISDQGSNAVTVQNNVISNANGEAISLSGNSSADTVSGNTLNNIGTAGGVNAAIDIESPNGTVSVTGNTYNQTSPYDDPSTEPAYYIYVSQGSPTVKNNKTNTMLGNFP